MKYCWKWRKNTIKPKPNQTIFLQWLPDFFLQCLPIFLSSIVHQYSLLKCLLLFFVQYLHIFFPPIFISIVSCNVYQYFVPVLPLFLSSIVHQYLFHRCLSEFFAPMVTHIFYKMLTSIFNAMFASIFLQDYHCIFPPLFISIFFTNIYQYSLFQC